DRPDLGDSIAGVLGSRWPAFRLAGIPGHGVDLDALVRAVPDHQVLLLDAADNVLGVGLSVPVDWDQTVDGLPAGWDGAVRAGAELLDRGGHADAVCGLSVTMTPDAAGRGLATHLVGALRAAAAQAGAVALLAPVRPLLKARYPLTSMGRYLSWRTADGEAFDPWLRLHLRLGGLQVGIAAPSISVTGSIADWQDWVDMPLPGRGEYIIAEGLVPLVVDQNAGTATYREPNVWVVHRAA
ncbi:MAG TPA: hypothetical protein VF755_16110, partial [Catenuloplanes sp.]